MTDTIGRVQFIVGFDGKNLPKEARKIARQMGKEGKKSGEEFGEGFDKAAAEKLGPNLTKAGEKAAIKLGKQGTLVGTTWSKNLDSSTRKIFRKMERETSDALASKEGFARFVKNAGSADDAIEKLKSNVNLLSKQVVKVGKNKIAFFDSKDGQEGWLTTIKRIDEYGKVALEAEADTKRMRDEMDKLTLVADKLKLSLNPKTFKDLSYEMGSSDRAAYKLRESMHDLNREGVFTDRELQKLLVSVDKLKDGFDGSLQKQTEYTIKMREAADAAADKQKRLKDLDTALASIESRMGNKNVFKQYAESVGGSSKAVRNLREEIDDLESRDLISGRDAGRRRRALFDLNIGIEKVGSSAATASPKIKSLGDRLKNALGSRGGLSTGGLVALIAAVIEPAGVLLQGLAGIISGALANVGAAVAGLAAIAGPALVGLGWSIGLAIKSMGMMEKIAPKTQAAMERLSKAVEGDARAFGEQWAPELEKFSNTLSQLWEDDVIGENLGRAFGEITGFFTDVLKSNAYKRFEKAMETSIPSALSALGGGLASGVEGILNIFATAAPHLETFAEKFQEIVGEWASGIDDMAKSGELDKLIEDLIDSMDILFDTIGDITSALQTFFGAGREDGNKMVEMLGDAFETWEKWMGSADGSEAIEDFFENSTILLEDVLDLLPDIQEGFEKIVTKDAVERMSDFVDEVGDLFSGPFADITNVIGELDVFGVLASVLNDLLTPLTSVFAALEPIVSIVSTLIEWIGMVAGAILTIISVALTPFQLAWEVINSILEASIGYLQPFFDLFEEVGLAITGVSDTIWETVEPALDGLFTAFTDLLPPAEEIQTLFDEKLFPILEDLGEFIGGKLVGLIESLTGVIITSDDEGDNWEKTLDAIETAMENVADFIKIWLVPAIEKGIEGIEDWVEENGGWEETLDDVLDAIDEMVAFIIDDMIPAIEDIVTWVGDVITAFEDFKEWIDKVRLAIKLFFSSQNGVPYWISATVDALGKIIGLQGQVDTGGSSGGGGGGGFQLAASGRMVTGPQRFLVGEAGTEAIVPLNRALSQVDPSVRALSAYAQGKAMPMASGGIAGAGRVANINEGAIRIYGSENPRQTAYEVLDVLANRIAG